MMKSKLLLGAAVIGVSVASLSARSAAVETTANFEFNTQSANAAKTAEILFDSQKGKEGKFEALKAESSTGLAKFANGLLANDSALKAFAKAVKLKDATKEDALAKLAEMITEGKTSDAQKALVAAATSSPKAVQEANKHHDEAAKIFKAEKEAAKKSKKETAKEETAKEETAKEETSKVTFTKEQQAAIKLLNAQFTADKLSTEATDLLKAVETADKSVVEGMDINAKLSAENAEKVAKFVATSKVDGVVKALTALKDKLAAAAEAAELKANTDAVSKQLNDAKAAKKVTTELTALWNALSAADATKGDKAVNGITLDDAKVAALTDAEIAEIAKLAAKNAKVDAIQKALAAFKAPAAPVKPAAKPAALPGKLATAVKGAKGAKPAATVTAAQKAAAAKKAAAALKKLKGK